MRSKKLILIISALEEAAKANGYQLVDVELGGIGHRSLVRVFLDKPEGLTLDAVAEANVWVNQVIETLDPFTGSYTLEVSSPGINRPLRTLEHFEQAAGQVAVISLEPSGNKQRSKYTGTLQGVQRSPDIVLIETDGQLEKLDFLSIKKANIKAEVSFENRKDA